MRVVLVSTQSGGGTLEHAALLGGRLRHLGVAVSALAATDTGARRFEAEGVPVDCIQMQSWKDLRALRRLASRVQGADIVHAHDRLAGLLTQAARLVRSIPTTVYTLHGIATPYLPPPVGDTVPRVRDWLAYEVVEPAFGRAADLVIVPSRHVAEDVVNRMRWSPRRMIVVPNGVRIESRSDVPPDVARFGAISRLDPFKGLDVFLRAVAVAHRACPEVAFTIFGDGPDRGRLERMARELEVADVVEFRGFVPARAALTELSVFVSTSYWENAPMAVLEAMAGCVPIIATRAGGVPEILTDELALLCPVGDADAIAQAMIAASNDLDHARRRAERARHHVEAHFDIGLNAERVLTAYHRAMGRCA